MNHQLIQIVDANDKVVGAAIMDDAQAKGLRHRIVRIMVEDKHGNLLLQKRSPNMETAPNLWDHSAAGHVDKDETWVKAARRELAEETGINTKLIREVGTYKSNEILNGRKLNRINKVYRIVIYSATPLKKDAEEVSELRWFSKSELKKLLNEKPAKTTIGLQYVYERYFISDKMNK